MRDSTSTDRSKANDSLRNTTRPSTLLLAIPGHFFWGNEHCLGMNDGKMLLDTGPCFACKPPGARGRYIDERAWNPPRFLADERGDYRAKFPRRGNFVYPEEVSLWHSCPTYGSEWVRVAKSKVEGRVAVMA